MQDFKPIALLSDPGLVSGWLLLLIESAAVTAFEQADRTDPGLLLSRHLADNGISYQQLDFGPLDLHRRVRTCITQAISIARLLFLMFRRS